ncbi:MAG: hypothetical protein WCR52_15440 [Bacteroidota bacterium]
MQDLLGNVLNDSLSNDTLIINADKSMTLFYTGDVAEKKASDIFTFFQNGLVPIGDSLVANPIQAPTGVTIRRADLKSGTVNLVINNSSNDTISGVFEIPQMTKNNVVFSMPFSVPPTPGTAMVLPLYNTEGYILRSNSNLLQFRYYAYNDAGQRITFPPINGLFPPVFVSFQNLQFSYLEGYWGYSTYPLTRDTIDININQTNLKGGVKVKNPKVTMRISNSWGFPTRGIVRYLSFIGKDGTEHKLESTIFNHDSVDFNYPSYALGEIGQTKYTDLYMDQTNSNIAEIFNSEPTKLIYEVDGVSNAKFDPSIIGFLTDSSNIKLSVGVELLLEGSAENFRADQLLDLKFGDYANLDTNKIESVEFKLVTENKTPISTSVQISFLDENGAAIDSLFAGGPKYIMQAAPTTAMGVANGTTRTENFIQMSVARFQRIRTAKQAKLETAFTTANGGQQCVRLLATDEAIIKMGLKVKTRL